MPYESMIGWRYLYRRKRSVSVLVGLAIALAVAGAGSYMFLSTGKPSTLGVAIMVAGAIGTVVFGLLALFSVYSTVSVVGVVLGVAALVIVFSVTSGFQAEFRDKVLGVNAHVLVRKSSDDFYEYHKVEKICKKLPHVIGVQPFIFEDMMLTRGKGLFTGIVLKGVDPKRVGSVLDLSQHMIQGKMSVLDKYPVDSPPPIILGRELAYKLRAEVGDEVTIVSPLSGLDVKTWSSVRPPKTKKFRVEGIFYAGFAEYDRRLAYVSIRELQDFEEKGDKVLGVEMRLDDPEQAPQVAAMLEQKLGDDIYIVQDWFKLNSNVFTALMLQKAVLVIVLTLIIVVAAFNMIASLTMMVLDKTKEIAILKSMGGTSPGVARVFQVVGLTIGGVGCVLGLGLGLLLCHVISRYGYPLDPGVYMIDKLPIRVHPLEVALVALITLVICFLATLYPALKASSLRPVEGLRYE